MVSASTLAMPYAKVEFFVHQQIVSGGRPIPKRNAEQFWLHQLTITAERLHLSRRPVVNDRRFRHIGAHGELDVRMTSDTHFKSAPLHENISVGRRSVLFGLHNLHRCIGGF